ncbi:MAG: TetR/AcrR family transcriptional regulator [Pseudomonadota bacterium]
MKAETGKKRSRGRPKIDAVQQKIMRNKIVAVASELFRSEGYAAVSMRRLGKELGVTPMTLYTYYPSKLAILSELWSEILDDAFRLVHENLRAESSAKAQLKSASKSFVSYWLENRENYHLVYMSSGLSREDVESFMSEENAADKFQLFFEKVAKLWGLEPSDPGVKTRTDHLLCGLHGIMHCVITVPGYEWTATDKLIELTVDSVVPH